MHAVMQFDVHGFLPFDSTCFFKLSRFTAQKRRYSSRKWSSSRNGSGLSLFIQLRPSRLSVTSLAWCSTRRCLEIAGRYVIIVGNETLWIRDGDGARAV